ncbi:MAG TPA: hypothetical protein PLN85_00045 [archaeon]|mgnify:CR=1 FL=1|nr:hypothetical protein [archaeon]
MDYSTFTLKTFYIKKDSTLPELKYPLTQHFREQYDITEDMLDNVGVTFSMIDSYGIFHIANVSANLVINDDRMNYPDEEKYTLTYRFKEFETSKIGRFFGEFKLDFLDNDVGCGKITIPTNGNISIVIFDSLTKTTVE